MDKAMQKALEADGEKLRALTDKDHGPHFIIAGGDPITCPTCGAPTLFDDDEQTYSCECGWNEIDS